MKKTRKYGAIRVSNQVIEELLKSQGVIPPDAKVLYSDQPREYILRSFDIYFESSEVAEVYECDMIPIYRGTWPKATQSPALP